MNSHVRLFFSGMAAVLPILLLGAAPGKAQPAVSRGKLLFLRCASCHDLSAGASSKIGPSLAGVVGRKAGALPGYAYSSALKEANLVWDEVTLDRWLTKPTLLVPGTAMAFVGLEQQPDRQAVIAYLSNPTP